MVQALMVLAQGRWDHMRGWDGGWMWLWGTLMMVAWVAVIGIAVWLTARAIRRDGSDARRARQILDERLARGELTLEEYRERRDVLR